MSIIDEMLQILSINNSTRFLSSVLLFSLASVLFFSSSLVSSSNFSNFLNYNDVYMFLNLDVVMFFDVANSFLHVVDNFL